jgi:two-component system, chemotaxis family, chemotaxis protein CheY
MAKILIVDDSSTMRESLNLILSSSGHKVDTGIHGLDGLEKFKNSRDYALIITDINMPEMNGLDFIANVRKISIDVPIIVLTTETEKEKIDIAKSYKASAWIVKPFKPADLLTVVSKVLSTHK